MERDGSYDSEGVWTDKRWNSADELTARLKIPRFAENMFEADGDHWNLLETDPLEMGAGLIAANPELGHEYGLRHSTNMLNREYDKWLATPADPEQAAHMQPPEDATRGLLGPSSRGEWGLQGQHGDRDNFDNFILHMEDTDQPTLQGFIDSDLNLTLQQPGPQGHGQSADGPALRQHRDRNYKKKNTTAAVGDIA